MALSSCRYTRSDFLLVSVVEYVVRGKTVPRDTLQYVDVLSLTFHCYLVFSVRMPKPMLILTLAV